MAGGKFERGSAANPKGKGGFIKGKSGNPKGGRPSPYQSFNVRACYLVERYTVGQIVDLVRAVELPKDKKLITAEVRKRHDAVRKLPSRDFMIMVRIAEAFTKGGSAAMDSLLNRALGKPPQHIAMDIEQNITAAVSISDTDKRAAAQKEADDMLAYAKKRAGSPSAAIH